MLEEFSRVSGTPLSGKAGSFEKARFEVYELEQQLLGRLYRLDKAARLKGLYLVLDTTALKGRDEVKVAAATIRGGTGVIQLRDKQRSKSELLAVARRLRNKCNGEGVLFIVNDHLDIALAVNADGIHLGQDDLPLAEARSILPIGMLIGCSTHSVAEAVLGDFAKKRDYSEATAVEIDNEIRRIVLNAEKSATELLSANMGKVEDVAMALLEREILEGSEIDTIKRRLYSRQRKRDFSPRSRQE